MFSQVVKHLKLVEEYLAGAVIAFQYLDGATPTKAQAERIAAFQRNLVSPSLTCPLTRSLQII